MSSIPLIAIILQREETYIARDYYRKLGQLLDPALFQFTKII